MRVPGLPVAAWSARLRKFEHGINELREMSLRDCRAARLREGTYEVGNIVLFRMEI